MRGRCDLLANHVLVIGADLAPVRAPCCGRSSVSSVASIRTKLVELWVVDPKGGMEFASGQRLCARYCYGDDEAADVRSQGRSVTKH